MKEMTGHPSVSSPSTAPGAVLLAEDAPSMRNAIEAVLSSAGYRVVAVEDGVAAWELLGERESREQFEVLVTDLDMPQIGRAHV